ncbi:MAG: hypothetical protein FWB91_00380 [Defluviitaleaceae bacterium]|nr:hypothetical protein [Defluviitaleaceae bacterium]
MEFDKRNVSRTYLLLSHDALLQGEIVIAAYYTIAIKTLNFTPAVSKRMIKDIDGFSKEADSVSAVLIGQLGKDAVHGVGLHGADVLSSAVDLAYEIRAIAGSRIVFLECEPAEKLLDFYNANGFVQLQNNQSTGLTQMVRFL